MKAYGGMESQLHTFRVIRRYADHATPAPYITGTGYNSGIYSHHVIHTVRLSEGSPVAADRSCGTARRTKLNDSRQALRDRTIAAGLKGLLTR
jgi:hypothetical protein